MLLLGLWLAMDLCAMFAFGRGFLFGRGGRPYEKESDDKMNPQVDSLKAPHPIPPHPNPPPPNEIRCGQIEDSRQF